MSRRTKASLSGDGDLFEGLSPSTLSLLREGAASRAVPAGGFLVKQGESATCLHLLREGCLKVTHLTVEGTPIGLGFLHPGKPASCAEVMTLRPHSASIAAVSDCVVLAWTKAQIDAVAASDPRLLHNMLRLVRADADALMSRLREQLTEPVEQRIARALLRISRSIAAGEPPQTPPVSRQDIAELTGTTHFTASRILKAWEARGIIANRRPRILLRNATRLEELAETGAPNRQRRPRGSRTDRAIEHHLER